MATGDIGMMALANRVFPSITPALVMSMGFIDLGKWVVAVEGGVQFGFNLMLLVLLFNCSAIFCQYLATCIGMVTGKNLAQICCEEYSRPVALLLGFQVNVSLIVSDMTNILGIAHGLNLLFGLDLFMCTMLAAVIVVSLSVVVTLLGRKNSEMLYTGISGSVLLFFVFGLLLAQPEVPIGVNGLFPRLNGENSYLIMALLGSNVIVHNFYSQSALVQHQRLQNLSVESALQDHLFVILFIFSGIFLANCVLMNSAASLFDGAGVSLFSFQDVILLMDQMFSIRIAPLAFFLVLLLSSLIKSLAWIFGGETVAHNFFGDEVPSIFNLAGLKFLAIAPAVFYAQSTGVDIYQLLIFCQVTLAVLLPSSVIPLFRVASSKSKMGNFTMSWHLEIVALFTSIWMLASNVIFLFEMLFGSSSWIVNIRTSMTLSFVFLLVTACTSLGLTFYLMVTPLKSVSNESVWELESNLQFVSHSKGNNFIGFNEVQKSTADPVPVLSEKSSVSDVKPEVPEKSTDLNWDSQSTTGLNFKTASTSSTSSDIKESNSVFDLQPMEPSDKLYNFDTSSVNSGGTDSNEPLERKCMLESPVSIEEGEEITKELELPPKVLPPIPNEIPETVKSTKEKPSDAASGPGSLSRLSGLGRAARRQFAAILDEFWSHLFDFHGQLIEEAKASKVDVLLGLEAEMVNSGKADGNGHEVLRKHLPETERGLALPRNSMDYSQQPRIPKSYGFQTASPVGISPWASNSELPYMYGQTTGNEALDPMERRYSSMQPQQPSDTWDYQPATIHGYRISSYLRGLTTGNLYDSSGFPIDQPSPQKCLESNYKDPLAYTTKNDRLNSLGISGFENQVYPPTCRQTEFENPSYDSSYFGICENLAAPEKKYHSLPDISGLSIAARAASLNNRNNMMGSRIGSPSGGRVAQEQQQLSSRSRAEGSLLTFDELSPPKNFFSLRSGSNPDNSSLWSKQPYEQLFGIAGASHNQGVGIIGKHNSALPEKISYGEMEMKLLNSLKNCIRKLLKLDGSEWLFKQDNGADEELIDQLVLKEKFVCEISAIETSLPYLDETHHLCSSEGRSTLRKNDVDLNDTLLIVKCGESCVWRASLVVSFGVWCIRRILELSLVESRPELWGKYTYVLNRLQGILGPAFAKPRSPIPSCPCLQIPIAYEREYGYTPPSKLGRSLCITSVTILEIIKDVEAAISSRKGRVGTAAGDVAFPKGKENLASVLKRYKRRLSNKSSAHQGNTASRKTSQQPTT